MESSSRTLVCSVLFLDIVEYTTMAVADQLQLKQAFNQVLANALDEVPARDRIILDTGDGAAVTFMGDSRPGQLLVSRSFYEVVSCLSRDYLNMFHHEGSRTDKHVREHEVYSVASGAPMARRVAESAMEITGGSTVSGWLASTGPLGLRHTALVTAPALFFAVIGGAMAVSAMLNTKQAPSAADPSTAPASAVVAAPAKLAAAAPAKPSSNGAKPASADPASADKPAVPPKKEIVASVEKNSAETKPQNMATPGSHGRLVLAITPWGDVLVDGALRGTAPALRTLEIPAGSHTIEVRNSGSPTYIQRIEVKPGQTVKIQHKFK